MLRIMSPGIDILRKLIGGDMEFYSESEKEVGKWFDSKPIYMKSFKLDDKVSNGTKLTTDSNIKYIIHAVGQATNSSTIYIFPYHTSSKFQPAVKNGNIVIENDSASGWYNLECTIFYTKIND